MLTFRCTIALKLSLWGGVVIIMQNCILITGLVLAKR
jgi:hypothetical protein